MTGRSFRSFFLFLTIFVLSASSIAFAQDKEWRPVSPSDLSSTEPVVEPGADAEAIFWEMRIDDSSSDDLDMWHYVRVKIFTEKGRETYSKFDIPYAKGTKIRNLTARVIRSDGTSIEITDKDIFDREIVRASGVKVKAKSFAVPNIEPGVIVEYKYKEAVDDAGASGMRLPLQRDLPVRKLTYYYKPNGKEPKYQSYNLTNFKFVEDKKGFYVAERTNVPAFSEEPRMPPEDQVRPWLLLTSTRFVPTSGNAFGFTFTIKDPSSPQLYWGGVAAERGGILKVLTKKDKKISAAAAQITAGASNQEEKLRKLYEFVQRDIKNYSYDSSLTDEQRRKLPAVKNISDILERKEAPTSTHINWLFAALADSLGMDVMLAFAGSRNQVFFNPNMTNDRLIFPVGVAITENGQPRIFSPGNKFLPFGMLPWYFEDSYTLLAGPEKYRWFESPALKPSENNSKRTGKFKLSEDGTLEGDVVVEITGQPAFAFRQTYWDETPETRVEAVVDGVKARMTTAEVTSVVIENMDDPNKPLIQRYKLRFPDFGKKTGSRIFIQPSVFQYGPSAIFSSSSRKHDIFFRHPWSETDKIDIAVPNGFSLDNAEAPASLSDPRKISSIDFKVNFDKANNVLLFERKFYFGDSNNIFFASSNYVPLKNLFDEFHKSDSHLITVKKN